MSSDKSIAATAAKILEVRTPLADEIWIPLKRATFDTDGVAIQWSDIVALARWCDERQREPIKAKVQDAGPLFA